MPTTWKLILLMLAQVRPKRHISATAPAFLPANRYLPELQGAVQSLWPHEIIGTCCCVQQQHCQVSTCSVSHANTSTRPAGSRGRSTTMQGSGRKYQIIRVEFSWGGQRNAVEVLVSGCEEGKDGELESPLKGWRDKDVQWRQEEKDATSFYFMVGHAQLSAAHTGITSPLYKSQQAQFSSSKLHNKHRLNWFYSRFPSPKKSSINTPEEIPHWKT